MSAFLWPKPRTDEHDVNRAIVRWFRMRNVTGRERAGRWMIIVGMLLVLLPLFAALIGISGPVISRFGAGFMALAILVGLTSLIASWFFIRAGVAQRWREARARGFCVCLGCGYALDERIPKGTCPECGAGFELAEMPRRWVERWGHAPRDKGRGMFDMFRPGPPWVLTASGEVRVPSEPGITRGERIGAVLGTIGIAWLGVWGGRAVIRYSQMLPGGLSGLQWALVGVVGAAFAGAGIATSVVTRRRLRERLAETDGRLCVRCQGSLAGLGEAGSCPACQTPFDAAELELAWWRYSGPAVEGSLGLSEVPRHARSE